MEKKSRAKGTQDAIALLIEDHKKVQKMFKDYDRLKEQDGADVDKSQLCKQICDELTIHTHIEEEIFYPAARAAIDEEDMLDEAEVEHASAKDLISQLDSMQPDDDLYDAKVTVLGEYIRHHVKEEQDKMFPKVKKTKLDLNALGEEMLERKQELQAEMGLAEPMDVEDEMPIAKSASRSSKKSAAGRRK